MQQQLEPEPLPESDVTLLKDAVRRLLDTDERIRALRSQVRMAQSEMRSLRDARKRQHVSLMQMMLRGSIDVLRTPAGVIRCNLTVSRRRAAPPSVATSIT